MKIEFVEGARNWYKWWSTWLQGAAAALLVYLEQVPDAAISVWNALPADLKAFVPQNVAYYFVVALSLAAIIAKTIKQRRLEQQLEAERARRVGQEADAVAAVAGVGDVREARLPDQ